MLLSCDIGNSSSVSGIFDEKGDIVKTLRIDTTKISSVQDLKKLFSKNLKLSAMDIKDVSVSSVVPSIDPVYKEFFKKSGLNPFFISSEIKLNIKICLENREKLGSDRIANACYAHSLNPAFKIIIDAGTALTIDVVDREGSFLGGIIYPGLSSLADSLYRSTEKLPLVNIGRIKTLIGTSTESSISSGLYHGFLFLIKGFIYNICEYYNCDVNNLTAIFTGGHSGIIIDDIDIKAKKILDENLTLKGIKYLYDLNAVNKTA